MLNYKIVNEGRNDEVRLKMIELIEYGLDSFTLKRVVEVVNPKKYAGIEVGENYIRYNGEVILEISNR